MAVVFDFLNSGDVEVRRRREKINSAVERAGGREGGGFSARRGEPEIRVRCETAADHRDVDVPVRDRLNRDEVITANRFERERGDVGINDRRPVVDADRRIAVPRTDDRDLVVAVGAVDRRCAVQAHIHQVDGFNFVKAHRGTRADDIGTGIPFRAGMEDEVVLVIEIDLEPVPLERRVGSGRSDGQTAVDEERNRGVWHHGDLIVAFVASRRHGFESGVGHRQSTDDPDLSTVHMDDVVNRRPVDDQHVGVLTAIDEQRVGVVIV